MALLLARRHQKLPSNPSLIRFFSNSSSDPPPKPVNPSTEKPSQSPSSPSPFTDIKTTLIQKLQQQQDQSKPPFPRSDSQSPNRGSRRSSDNQSRGSIHDFGKNLANFQRRSTVPPSNDSSGVRPSQSRPQISLESLYKQNVAPNSTDPRNRKAPELNLDRVRESLWNLKNQSNTSTNMDTSRNFQGALKSMAQGEDALPMSVFRKEIDGIKEGETEEMTTEFLTFYNEEELGEKLRLLRPEGNKEEGWFSLQELNQRLVKLRQVEEKEVQTRSGNTVLRTVISNMRNDAAKNEKQNINFFSYLGDEYKLHPPKEELVETYFHPDNLSSAEKMKIELTKVRDEFKMSESDCGSARVQVAQLTTKIKHLSSLLHKKDKHSRKGLLGMVQKRKKLLKYLRRTDWDSYCLVLSKLSLRDNPDYKF